MTDDNSNDSFAALFEAETRGQTSHKKARLPSLGERVRAEVVQIGKDAVFVEVLGEGAGIKRAQAYINVVDVAGQDGALSVQLGDVIEAVVVDAKGGEIRLGRGMGRPTGLDELSRAYEAAIAVEGKVTGVNKGGLEVEVAGARAFCPISQADNTYVADPQSLVGRTLQFLITELKEGGKRIVLSRRKLLEAEARVSAEQILAKVVAGAVLPGTVTRVREFGAFVDLGGVEGLLPNAELSYDRSATAESTLNVGDRVEVQVREIKDSTDKRGNPTKKISLSLKSLAQDPWEAIDAIAPVGRVVRGSVVRVLDFGGFIRLSAGVEGLLHVSELGGKVSDASTALNVGDAIDVVVRSVDRAARKISLAPAPEGLAVGAEARGPSIGIGAIVKGVVDHVETFGVFMQIEGTRGRAGRGLIPNAELGVARGADTRKLFPVGASLTAKVLETGDGKLRLSLRAVKDDEERADFEGFRANSGANQGLGTFADLLRKR